MIDLTNERQGSPMSLGGEVGNRGCSTEDVM